MSDALFSVEGQKVLVSGGSRGIGRAIAAGFAQRGAEVIIASRDAASLEQTAAEISTGPVKVRPLVCDVADAAAVARLAPQALELAGHIDVLINVAGVNRRKPFEAYSPEDYDFILDINLKGPFLLTQAVGKTMLERRSGNVINIASLNNTSPLKHVAPYAMSKAALGHMTRSLAMEWGPRGIRVNALAPGFVLTDLTKQLWSRPDMQAWNMANCPQQRLGLPEDMVGTAIFLASKASSFLTGQIITVDGGFTAGMAWPIDAQ